MTEDLFYGPDQSAIHHSAFGFLARDAAAMMLSLLGEARLREGTVVDLGSGSGIFAGILSDAGYRVEGVDISPDMVELASRNAPAASFRVGSLLDAELPPAVAVTALGEPLNYATDPRAGLEELGRLARRVHESLAPGGVFLFDVSGPGREGPARTRRVWHDRDGWVLSMRTQESEDGTTLDRLITIFTRNEDGSYRRTDEHHVLRLYRPEAVVELLERNGFDVQVLDDYRLSDDDPSPAHPPLPGWHVFLARRPA